MNVEVIPGGGGSRYGRVSRAVVQPGAAAATTASAATSTPRDRLLRMDALGLPGANSRRRRRSGSAPDRGLAALRPGRLPEERRAGSDKKPGPCPEQSGPGWARSPPVREYTPPPEARLRA